MQINEYHGDYNISPRRQSIEYIVCHYVGNGDSSPGNALNNCKYFAGGDRGASAHYFIDDGGIWEYANPDEYYTWHCGDGHGAYGITNANSVGIEVCIDGDTPYTDTEIEYLRELVCWLMDRYGIDADRVVRHYDASRKSCPYFYTPYGSGGDGAWYELRDYITSGKRPAQEPGEPMNDAGMWYRVHAQDLGWLDAVRDGQIAGTVGSGLRMEAFKMTPPDGWTLYAKAHIQDVGWVTYPHIKRGDTSGEGSSQNDPIIGTIGESKRIESLIIGVEERPAGDNRKLWFKVHQQDYGWKSWTEEGYASGADGMSLALEAIQIVIE